MKKTYKRVPFGIELAEKIQSGEVAGRIVYDDGNNPAIEVREIHIFNNDSLFYNVVCVIEGSIHSFTRNGELFTEGRYSLFIELTEVMPKHEFKPFDKVLVRDIDSFWSAAYYSHYEKEEDKHSCGGVLFDECIPYEGNEYLVGTTNKPKEE